MSTVQKPRVRKIARVRNEADDSYFDVIEFRTTNNKRRRLEVAPSEVNNVAHFAGLLLNADALLPKEKESRETLLTSVAGTEAAERWEYAAQAGFIRAQKGYVFHDGFVGSSKVKILGGRNPKPGENGPVRLAVRADSTSWAGSVGCLAKYSTALMLSVSAAFAAPLLAFTNRGSFAINMTGPSRSGKSIATLVGASVIGVACVDDLLSWNTTDAALEERLAEFNDALFPIDDLENMKGNGTKDKYGRICTLAYNISHGSPKDRHSSFQKGHARRWRVIVLTSSEKTLQDFARLTKQVRSVWRGHSSHRSAYFT
jgi:hypothetical protein